MNARREKTRRYNYQLCAPARHRHKIRAPVAKPQPLQRPWSDAKVEDSDRQPNVSPPWKVPKWYASFRIVLVKVEANAMTTLKMADWLLSREQSKQGHNMKTGALTNYEYQSLSCQRTSISPPPLTSRAESLCVQLRARMLWARSPRHATLDVSSIIFNMTAQSHLYIVRPLNLKQSARRAFATLNHSLPCL